MLSPAALASGWVALERSTAVHRDPANAGRRFIPLLLGDCALPDTLRRYKYVDFREESAAAVAEVLAACRRETLPVLLASTRANQGGAEKTRAQKNRNCLVKVCVFCGEPGVTREHIISTAVQKRMQLTGVEIEIGVREETGDGEFRDAHGLNQLVTRRVCAACNSGWMSQLEVDFLAAAGPLIEPEWPRLETEFLGEAVKKSEVIARWAVKTARNGEPSRHPQARDP